MRTDRNGDVAAGRPIDVGLRVYRQARPGTRVNVALRVWASHDEGATWQRVNKVKPTGGGAFTATIPHSRGAETVSLRVEATGPHGASIDQTVTRAFGVRTR